MLTESTLIAASMLNGQSSRQHACQIGNSALKHINASRGQHVWKRQQIREGQRPEKVNGPRASTRESLNASGTSTPREPQRVESLEASGASRRPEPTRDPGTCGCPGRDRCDYGSVRQFGHRRRAATAAASAKANTTRARTQREHDAQARTQRGHEPRPGHRPMHEWTPPQPLNPRARTTARPCRR
jgi:hypothetical protein